MLVIGLVRIECTEDYKTVSFLYGYFNFIVMEPILTKLKTQLLEMKRVWSVTKKPSMEEFKSVVKVAGLGIIIIGLIGFLIDMMWYAVK